MILYSGIAALLLALIHLFAENLKFSAIPRSKWLSFAGGVSVTYIFMHLLPEIAEGQEQMNEKGMGLLEHGSYLVALVGLALFYGLERAAKQSPQSARSAPGDEMPENLEVFWLHISSFGFYNAIIGYLLVHQDENSALSLLWFALAMAFHFVVNDYGLIEHYQNAYRGKGRWIITGAIIAGWLVGALAEIPEVWIMVLVAFIGGGIIMNVLKEELPQERKSNFWAFLAGIVFYTALLLIQ